MEYPVNRQIVLRRRPHGTPTEGDFELRTTTAPEPGDGGILVRTLLLSVEPAMRGWVLEAPNYLPAVPVGGAMRSFGVGEVVESREQTLQPRRYRHGPDRLAVPHRPSGPGSRRCRRRQHRVEICSVLGSGTP